ncbi:hypothetical protein HZH68_013692 [Vespula germanica]|uniref:Uncharacterized protein n=1 Tax=Vespula germanica TaxID=30212 RepID=A0A834MTY7_VESGE|nr:hypothetical protein HZH68_013692 [Vespula germanica]
MEFVPSSLVFLLSCLVKSRSRIAFGQQPKAFSWLHKSDGDDDDDDDDDDDAMGSFGFFNDYERVLASEIGV